MGTFSKKSVKGSERENIERAENEESVLPIQLTKRVIHPKPSSWCRSSLSMTFLSFLCPLSHLISITHTDHSSSDQTWERLKKEDGNVMSKRGVKWEIPFLVCTRNRINSLFTSSSLSLPGRCRHLFPYTSTREIVWKKNMKKGSRTTTKVFISMSLFHFSRVQFTLIKNSANLPH